VDRHVRVHLSLLPPSRGSEHACQGACSRGKQPRFVAKVPKCMVSDARRWQGSDISEVGLESATLGRRRNSPRDEPCCVIDVRSLSIPPKHEQCTRSTLTIPAPPSALRARVWIPPGTPTGSHKESLWEGTWAVRAPSTFPDRSTPHLSHPPTHPNCQGYPARDKEGPLGGIRPFLPSSGDRMDEEGLSAGGNRRG